MTLPFLFLFIAIGSPFADTPAPPEDIRDIKGIITRDVESSVVLSALFLALAVLPLIFLWMKRRNKPKPLSSLASYEVALSALQALKEKDLLTKGKVEDYYLEIAGIIRRYLEDEYGWKTGQMTAEECLSRLEAINGPSPGQKDLLKELLKMCDLVKFARNQPTSKESERTFEMAREIILQTKEAV